MASAKKRVRIGDGGARIVSVSAESVIYVGAEGENRLANSPVERGEKQYIGARDMTGTPPWIRLCTVPEVIFEFESRDAAYEQLLDPLRIAGLHTFDTS